MFRAFLALMIVTSHATAFACVAPPTGMTHWWQGEGTVDEIVSGHDAALQNGATFAWGHVGQAYSFDGTNDFASVAADPSLNFGTADFTVNFWARFTSLSGEQILLEKYVETFNSGTAKGWSLTKLSNNSVRLVLPPLDVNTPVLGLVAGAWHHFAIRRSGNTFTLWFDGTQVASGTRSPNTDSTSSLKFGRRGSPADTPGSTDNRGFFLRGQLDEIQLFVGHAVPDLQLQAIYAAGAVGLCPVNCGDGILQAPESCDDGANVSGNGCSGSCRVEPCFTCTGEPSVCSPAADGHPCDDGLFCNGADSCSGGSCIHIGDPCPGGSECDGACNELGDNCMADAGTPCTPLGDPCYLDKCDGAGTCGIAVLWCGDGLACGSEGCDDGNFEDGDGCDSNCTTTACGNGVVTNDETCDDGNSNSGDGCDNNCTVSTCGNGVVAGHEICDDGNDSNGDGCDENCTVSACGNGVTAGAEMCDDGNPNEGDGCDTTCVPSGCGNAVVSSTEACDDGNRVNGDGCDNNCTFSACGNGVLAPGEVCDEDIDPNLNWDTTLLGKTDGDVYTVLVAGDDIYIGGDFVDVDGVPANSIARWDGSAWHALGSGVDGHVLSLAMVGSDLFVGGGFGTAGSQPANSIAKWNGSTWSALGAGVDDEVYAIAAFEGKVYVGGAFSSAGGIEDAPGIASWDGTQWSTVGTGADDEVYSLAVHNSKLYVGGAFSIVGGKHSPNLAIWDGRSWSKAAVSPEFTAQTMLSRGTDLWVTGGGVIGRWNGAAWAKATIDGEGGFALAVSGNDLFVGGDFGGVGNTVARSVARWDGAEWSSLGSGANNFVYGLGAVGTKLYVGGTFTVAGGLATRGLAIWHLPGCGNGTFEAGEQCDDGNAVEGDGCDSNCTISACGNGRAAASAGEECDDGNAVEGDGCDSNCTATACGNGIRTAVNGEACDDGNPTDGDGCDNDCRYTPVAANLPPGGTITTDQGGSGASAAIPVQVGLTTPAGGQVSIASVANPEGSEGFQAVGVTFSIDAPSGTVTDPLRIVLVVDPSALPAGITYQELEITRDGVLLAPCTNPGAGVAVPDPCIEERTVDSNGDVVLTALSVHASDWGAAVRAPSAADKRCINAINKAAVKVAKAQVKAELACLKGIDKGDITDAEACVTSGNSGSTDKATAATVATEAKACTSVPNIGFSGATATNAAARDGQIALARDLFGADLAAAFSPDREPGQSKCQNVMIKAIDKLFAIQANSFLQCKKTGLSSGAIATSSQLASCFDSLRADSSGKITKAVNKLRLTVTKKCNQGSLTAILPGACSAELEAGTCLAKRTACRMCQSFRQIDDLGYQCDSFDDGANNDSCP